MGAGSGGADILFRAEVDATGAITSLKMLDAQTQSTGKGAAGAAGGIAGFGQSVLSLKNTIVGAAVAGGLYKLTDWMGETIKLAGESQLEQIKLEAVLRATGNAVGMTAGQLDAMATRLSRATGFDDEMVKSAESLLLTFTSIPGEAFEPTMKAAADLAVVMGTDLRGAVSVLGRVLENPAEGMNMLRRNSIVLSDAIKAQVKDLQDHGRLLEAQSLLLSEVNKRTNEVAATVGGAFAKSLEKVKNEWSNVREEMGGFVTDSKSGLGALSDLSTVLGAIADSLKKMRDEDKATGQAAAGGLLAALSSMIPGMGGAVTNVQQLVTVLGAAATKIRDADAASKMLVSSHKGLASSISSVTSLSDEEKKKLESLLDTLDPLRKATGDYNENLKLLGEALAAGEINQGQYNEAVKASKDALDKAREASGLFLPKLQDLGDKWDWVRNIVDSYTASVEEAAQAGLLGGIVGQIGALQAELRQGIEGGLLGGIVGSTQFNRFSDEIAKGLGNAFKDGFLKAFEGGDTIEAWKTLSNGLAGMFAKSLGDTVAALFQGKPLTGEGGALEAGGLWSKEKGFDWKSALGMGGGLISSYAQQGGDKTMGAIGGMMSGAGMGATIGSVIPGLGTAVGAIIGAIIGGIIGYFGTPGQKSVGYTYGVSADQSLVKYSGVGPGYPEQAEQARQLTDKYVSTVTSFHDLLTLLKQPLENPTKTLNFGGKTGDANSLFSMILKNDLPRAIFDSFKPLLSTGLTGLGASEGRAGQLLGQFSTGNFDAAMTALKAWITAITSLGDVSALLGATPDEMRAKVSMTLRDSFLSGFEDVMKQAGDLTTDLDKMFSQEQVANAEKLLSVAQDQYQAGLQYFAQMEQISKAIGQQVTDVLTSFDEQRAAEKGQGQLASFYETQLNALQGQLAGATSAEQVQTIMAAILKYGQELWGLQGADNQPRNVMDRADIEEFIRQAQKKAQEEIDAWQQEVADKNAALKSEVDAMTAALTTATSATSDLTDTTNDLNDALDGAAGASGRLRGALEQASDALGEFIGSIQSAGGAVSYARSA